MGAVSAGAPARTQTANGLRQLLGVVVQVRNQFGRRIKAHYHGLILPRPDDAVDELDRGFLFELEPVANAVAGIDQNGDAQRQIGLGREFLNHLWLFVFRDGEILSAQVGDEATLLVGYREQDVNARDIDGDPRRRWVGRRRFLR